VRDSLSDIAAADPLHLDRCSVTRSLAGQGVLEIPPDPFNRA
jgi:hypothetical protein